MAEDPVKDLTWAHVQFNKGLRENNKGNYTEGLKLLLEIWPKYKTYDVASEISRAEGELGHHAAGSKYAAYTLSHLLPREGSEFKKLHVERLNLSLPYIYSATLKVTPTDLTVTIDGVELDVPTDVGLYLEPGHHRVEFKRSGYVTETREIDAKANVQEKLVIDLKKEGETAKAVSFPTDTPATEKPAPGAVQPAPFVEPPPDPTLSWTILGIGSGLTALAVGTGVYFHVKGSDSQSNADRYTRTLGSSGCSGEKSDTCNQLHAALVDKTDNYTRAKILYGVGTGLAVVTGLATWYFWPSTNDKQAPKVSAWATPDSAGIVTFGRF
jgi:hypothetical protein